MDVVSTSYLVMGVSGSGKSTIGSALAHALGIRFVDGDDLHSDANRQKMAAGIALDDDDRAPWLDSVGAVLWSGRVVVACSALKRAYRDRVRAAASGVQLVYLEISRDVLDSRVADRRGHFMPASLLDSQLQTLEPPAADEHPLIVDSAQPIAEIVAILIERIPGA